jgi:hypothetical protein
MNLLHEFGRTSASSRLKWCERNGVFLPRIKRLASTYLNLRRRVAEYLNIQDEKLAISNPPSQMAVSQLTVLRALHVWVFHDTIIEFSMKKPKEGDDSSIATHSVRFESKSDRIQDLHIDKVLGKYKPSFRLAGYSEVKQIGTFVPAASFQSVTSFGNSFEPKCVSYCTDKDYALAVVSFPDSVTMYVTAEVLNSPSFKGKFDTTLQPKRLRASRQPTSKKLRGISERSCGCWSINEAVTDEEPSQDVVWYKLVKLFDKEKKQKSFENELRREVGTYSRSNGTRLLFFTFPWKTTKDALQYDLVCFSEGKGISNPDLADLFGTPNFKGSIDPKHCGQSIVFDMEGNNLGAKGELRTDGKALMECIPEGARLLSVIASSRRREHVILFPESVADEKKASTPRKDKVLGVNEEEDKALVVHLPPNTNITKRWKRFGTNNAVYVDVDSVAASAVPTDPTKVLYCCAANTLEVRGGAIRAEGLTMLPPGRLFLLLCKFSMGIFSQSQLEDGSIYEIATSWIDNLATKKEKKDMTARVKKAIELHQSSLALQEQLQCFPDKVRELLSIFDGINGEPIVEWDGLKSDPFLLVKARGSLVPRSTYRRVPRETANNGNPTGGLKTVQSKKKTLTGGDPKKKKGKKVAKKTTKKKKEGKLKQAPTLNKL